MHLEYDVIYHVTTGLSSVLDDYPHIGPERVSSVFSFCVPMCLRATGHVFNFGSYFCVFVHLKNEMQLKRK